ncbi:hypothetical protein KTT_29520 [Tengunoibacter tsumagoiensis]|uniref:Uncharacterized protein n=1 Tax=Tengunoibacter tsumagoiensis TaxID=2014871 RepID=A0A402A1S1_9CHLR|nr:hypothetical protein KTT_29520 [Tengunoibacter tsumagoiensis]
MYARYSRDPQPLGPFSHNIRDGLALRFGKKRVTMTATELKKRQVTSYLSGQDLRTGQTFCSGVSVNSLNREQEKASIILEVY